jgi:hypothetical protein
VTRDEVAAALAKLTPKERADVEDLVLEVFANRERERLRRQDPEREARWDSYAARFLEVCAPFTPEAEAAIREAFGGVMRARIAEAGRKPEA